MVSKETFYRQAAGEGATYIGLLIVVYDTLAGDLRRAGGAAERGDIAARCDATNHALLLLGHLESWASALPELSLRESLGQFYSFVRIQALALQAAQDKRGFVDLAQLVEETRAVWQQKEASVTGEVRQLSSAPQTFASDEMESFPRASWSA